MSMKTQNETAIPRRTFLKNSAISAGAMISSSRLAAANIIGANDRIRLGAIGVGGRSRGSLTPIHKKQPDTEIVALCDVYEPNLQRAAKDIEVESAKQIRDYRALL